jgi:hypothetical protein
MQPGAYSAEMMIVKRNNVSDMKCKSQRHRVSPSCWSIPYLFVTTCFIDLKQGAALFLLFYVVGNSKSQDKIGLTFCSMSTTLAEMIFGSAML